MMVHHCTPTVCLQDGSVVNQLGDELLQLFELHNKVFQLALEGSKASTKRARKAAGAAAAGADSHSTAPEVRIAQNACCTTQPAKQFITQLLSREALSRISGSVVSEAQDQMCIHIYASGVLASAACMPLGEWMEARAFVCSRGRPLRSHILSPDIPCTLSYTAEPACVASALYPLCVPYCLICRQQLALVPSAASQLTPTPPCTNSGHTCRLPA